MAARSGRTRISSGAMHLVIMLAIGGATLAVFARLLASAGRSLPELARPALPSLAGLAIGVVAAATLLSTQADLVDDDVEAAVAPLIAAVVTVALGAIGWRRLVRP